MTIADALEIAKQSTAGSLHLDDARSALLILAQTVRRLQATRHQDQCLCGLTKIDGICGDCDT